MTGEFIAVIISITCLACVWLLYRHEHRELMFSLIVEHAYAEGMKRKAVAAIERERLRRFDLASLPVDKFGEN